MVRRKRLAFSQNCPLIFPTALVARDRGRRAPSALSNACQHRGVSRCPLPACQAMLFYSFFKTLVGKEIVVELKNGAAASQLASQQHNFL